MRASRARENELFRPSLENTTAFVQTTSGGNQLPGFYDYFRENMEGLGLPAPATLYGNFTTALATAGTIVGVIEKFGPRVTVMDAVIAGLLGEQLLVVGGMSAAGYAGAVIGSLAVATGRSLSGGTSLADVLSFASSKGLNAPWLTPVLVRNPQLYNRRVAAHMHPAAIR
jgi:hypothetical protein